MTTDLAEFLAIVDCRPEDVQDIPAERRNVDPLSGCDPSKGIASRVIYFGKHKGKRFSDIPTDYLEWMVENITQGPSKKAAKHARAELKRRRRKS